MKVYIAGLLKEEKYRKKLEEVDKLCKELGFETFLPHRDVGVFEEGDSKPFFVKDRDMVDWCDLMVAVIDWKGISSGTAWEMGYAYAKKVPIIGLVEDKESFGKDYRICVMCYNSAYLVESLDELKKELEKRKNEKQ